MPYIGSTTTGKIDRPPPDLKPPTSGNKIYNNCKRAQMSRAFVLFFCSTFFDAIQSGMPLDCLEKRRIFMPRCRGPPLLKSNRFLGFQKKRRFCPMRQFYIRAPWAFPAKAMHQRSSQTRSSRIINGHIYAKHPNNFVALLQCAENRPFAKKLFLFGSAASGLTVRLPNMDQMTGGGLK